MTDVSTAKRFEALADEYWVFACTESPVTAILAGEDPDDPVLFRESPADHARRRSGAVRLREILRSIPADALGVQDLISHRLLARELDTAIEAYEHGAHLRPSLFPAGPEFSLVFVANTTSIATPRDAERYLARLATVPDFFDDLKSTLEAGLERGFRYPSRVVHRAAQSAKANLKSSATDSALFGPFQRGNAQNSSAISAISERAAALIEGEIMPALANYVAFIEDRLGSAARDSIACSEDEEGEAWYQHLVKTFTSLEISPAGIHQLGLQEVERLLAEQRAVAAEAGFEHRLAAYRDHLTTAPEFFPPTVEQHLNQVRSLCKQIDALIPAFFGLLPRITYGVECIPESLSANLPPAYAQPGPADNSSPGIFWVTSLLEKCPTYMYPSLALHEAWPGHLMQIALMQEQKTLPAFRRNGALKYTACVEGWAMYCEQLGEDMGVYRSPHERFGRLNMEMWRAVRLVLDTGIHSRGWSREDAIEYMSRLVLLAPSMIEAEVDRYMALPGQALAYQLGNLQFRALRQAAELRLGDRFDIRRFHDALIAAGPVTLPILEELCESWLVAEERAEGLVA